jgi:hypothetical protein
MEKTGEYEKVRGELEELLGVVEVGRGTDRAGPL